MEKTMKNQTLISFFLVLFFSTLYFTTISAQSPASSPASAPPTSLPTLPDTPADAPESGPTDIITILRKAKGFSVLVRLLKTTQLINQINSQLITTKSGGLTIFAPDDNAFSELKPGFLNSLDDSEKTELLQFHVLPNYVSSSNFDTLTNPVRTVAGENPARLQLNVTSYGGSVNISTGVVNTTVTGVVYLDKRLAMYQVGKVLLPLDLVLPKKAAAPAPAPVKAGGKPDKETPSTDDTDNSNDQVLPTEANQSGAISTFSLHGMWVSLGVAFVAVTII